MKKLAALTAILMSPLAWLNAPAAAQGFSAKDGEWVLVKGSVSRMLEDDHDGSPHQRFILRLDSGYTLLITHNVDLAPRLEGLRLGERLEIYGQFETNDRGGVIHWTHHDPQGRQPGGYIERQGRRYR